MVDDQNTSETKSQKRYIRRRKEDPETVFGPKNDEITLDEALNGLCRKKKKNKLFHRFLVAVVITLVFIFLYVDPFRTWFRRVIPHSYQRLLAKALIIFVVALLILTVH